MPVEYSVKERCYSLWKSKGNYSNADVTLKVLAKNQKQLTMRLIVLGSGFLGGSISLYLLNQYAIHDSRHCFLLHKQLINLTGAINCRFALQEELALGIQTVLNIYFMNPGQAMRTEKQGQASRS